MGLFYHIGRYFTLMLAAFGRPERFKIYRKRIVEEMVNLGINSLGIVALMSVFMGMVITLQTASNIDTPLIPSYTVGFATRQSIVLEFSPTIICLILAGKVGSIHLSVLLFNSVHCISYKASTTICTILSYFM